MKIQIEKRADIPATEIKIRVYDDYLEQQRPDPYAHLIRNMSIEDQLGMVTDAVHSFFGVMPPLLANKKGQDDENQRWL